MVEIIDDPTDPGTQIEKELFQSGDTSLPQTGNAALISHPDPATALEILKRDFHLFREQAAKERAEVEAYRIANIIFIDAPVGTGFSYSTTQEGYNTSDTESSEAVYQFLRKWMLKHPKFRYNPLYIAGDSYSGIIVPQVILKVSNGNRNGVRPPMKLQGYLLGNPVTELHSDENSRIEFYHRVTLISSELYESIQENCKGEYVYPNVSNSDCMDDIGLVAEAVHR
ncbi:hypothetical protein ACLB2K_017038 [Fragaria x ananassa]